MEISKEIVLRPAMIQNHAPSMDITSSCPSKSELPDSQGMGANFYFPILSYCGMVSKSFAHHVINKFLSESSISHNQTKQQQ